MNKVKLTEMILDYVSYKEKARDAFWYQVRCHKNKWPIAEEATDAWLDLIMQEDDHWQNLINYIYEDEEEEE